MVCYNVPMQSIALTTQQFLFTKPVCECGAALFCKSERACIINRFTKRINADRVGTTYGEISGRAVAMKLSHVNKQDLLYFYDLCSRSSHFSKCFFGRLRSKGGNLDRLSPLAHKRGQRWMAGAISRSPETHRL